MAPDSRHSRCFPEPTSPDPTPARRGETTGSWLARSTWIRAVECRRFYDSNLAALPEDAADALCARLRCDRLQAAHFELVVGRFLQVLGAEELRYEVPGTEGASVDWVAVFADGAVSVEATAPAVNAVIGAAVTAAGPIMDLLLEIAPPGWHPMVVRGPQLAPTEPRRWLRRRLEGLLTEVPPPAGVPHEIELQLENGLLQISLLPASDPTMRPDDVTGPFVGYIDDTSDVVHRAVAGKRRQARGATKPVLAAVYAAGFGDDEIEKFDIALFGRTVVHQGRSEVSIDRSGVFGKGEGEPTFAGALAFAGLGWRGGPDPVLYIHPRFTGHLPEAIASLRTRTLSAVAIDDTPARSKGALQQLGWPTS